MKIRSLKFEGHPALGDIYLDFVDPESNDAFSTVVLAGENGCGKTQILQEIYSVFGEINTEGRDVGTIHIELQIDPSTLSEIRKKLNANTLTIKDGKFYIRYQRVGGHHWSNVSFKFIDDNGNSITRGASDYILPFEERRPFRAFFSEAFVAFSSRAPDAVRATELDQGVAGRRGGEELASQISQLLVDIRASDNEDLAVWTENNPGLSADSSLVGKRISRFKEAIAYMFPRKRLRTVKPVSGALQIQFEELGRITSLNQLSTGEKQIVFRGGFVLRDLANIQGGILLVDEPELSLHPDWQARILGFYQRLLPNNMQISTQLIVATHSPFVVHEQLNSKTIILSRNNQTGSIQVEAEPSYPATGQSRMIKALNVDALISKTEQEIVVLVEGVTDQKIIQIAWKKLYPNEIRFFDIRPALGAGALRATLSDDQAFIKNPGKKIVGIFDFDIAYDSWNQVWNKNSAMAQDDAALCLLKKHLSKNGWAMLLPVPDFRQERASKTLGSMSVLTIELLFQDADHISGMIEYCPLPAANAFKPKMRDGMKAQFVVHVENLPQASFDAFRPIFDRLRELI